MSISRINYQLIAIYFTVAKNYYNKLLSAATMHHVIVRCSGMG